MPPRQQDRGKSEKATAALQRKVDVLREKQESAKKAAEDAKWADEGSTLKERRAAEKARQEAEKAEAAARKKALKDAEDGAAEDYVSKQKRSVRVTKVTQHEVALHQEAEAARRAAQEHERALAAAKIMLPAADLPSNLNHEMAALAIADAQRLGGADNVVQARGIAGATKALDFRTATLAGVADRHPEKRRKAAYKAFEAKMSAELRAEEPTLKFSQVKERVWKLWLDSDENPDNNQQPK